MSRFLALCLLAAAGLCAKPASAATGRIELLGVAIPLPPGEWRELGRVSDHRVMGVSNEFYPIEERLLVQEADGRLTGFIMVEVMRHQVRTIDWHIPATCTRTDTLQTVATSAGPRDQNCRIILHEAWSGARPANPRRLLAPLFDQAERQPGWLPRPFGLIQFRLASTNHAVTLDYRFVATGLSGGWTRPTIDASSTRLRAWADAAQPLVEAGFRRGATSALPAF